MYTIRYKTKQGGSGMTNTATNQDAKDRLLKLFKNKLPGRVEKNNIIIGEVYKIDGRWNWYLDTEA